MRKNAGLGQARPQKRIQNKCLRIITKAHSRTHRRVFRNLTHSPSLASRHTYLYLCEFYKLYKNISPKLLNDMLIVNTESMYDSRSAAHCNVKIVRMNKRVGQRSLNYLGPIIFNSLPTNIKTSPSFSIFKKRLREKIPFSFQYCHASIQIVYIILYCYKNVTRYNYYYTLQQINMQYNYVVYAP